MVALSGGKLNSVAVDAAGLITAIGWCFCAYFFGGPANRCPSPCRTAPELPTYMVRWTIPAARHVRRRRRPAARPPNCAHLRAG